MRLKYGKERFSEVKVCGVECGFRVSAAFFGKTGVDMHCLTC